ncbi:MAG: class I SAM-dependent methyltransferase [Bryobacteraceae bacterium]
MPGPDISELVSKAKEFKLRLDSLKGRFKSAEFEWYPYNSLSTFDHLDRLLTGKNRLLLDLIGDRPLIDLGCGDGDISFFLESLGCKVHAIDYSPPNHNSMRGVRTLRDALQSKVEIYDMNLDGVFSPPSASYGVAFLLGALYHLRNPFHVLELLSRHVKYCVMSTRIAAVLPGSAVSIRREPIAYLVDEDELNSDNSNYWIFSDSGLRRLLKRTHWDILDYVTVGEAACSDPIRADRDERAFCLARSNFALGNVELLYGWHEAEEEGWRWTRGRFAVQARPSHVPASLLRMRLFIPQAVMERLGSVTLYASIDGCALVPEKFTDPGIYTYHRPLGHSGEGALEVSFWLDRILEPGEGDDRELGIIVSSLTVE